MKGLRPASLHSTAGPSLGPRRASAGSPRRAKDNRWRCSRVSRSLAEDSLEDEIPPIKVRLESLSDLVFGLALSIGSLSLILKLPMDAGALSVDVEVFAFSFLIIVGVWLNYSRIVSVLPTETGGIMSLNLALLFCVAIEPFLFYLLFKSAAGFEEFCSTVFALDTGAMMGLLSGMIYLVLRAEGRGAHKLNKRSIRRFRASMVSGGVGSLVFLASSSSTFWVMIPGLGHLRYAVWFVALVLLFGSRTVVRVSSRVRRD